MVPVVIAAWWASLAGDLRQAMRRDFLRPAAMLFHSMTDSSSSKKVWIEFLTGSHPSKVGVWGILNAMVVCEGILSGVSV
jgi:hypothetical protein